MLLCRAPLLLALALMPLPLAKGPRRVPTNSGDFDYPAEVEVPASAPADGFQTEGLRPRVPCIGSDKFYRNPHRNPHEVRRSML